MSVKPIADQGECAVVRRGARRPVRRHLRLIVAALASCAVLALAVGFFVFVGSVVMERPRFTGHAGGVVALTGGADRINDAIELLAEGRADRLLITGVNQATTGASIARLTPQYRSLFACCIDLGYAASNTVGNATETRRWVAMRGIKSVIVVTSNWHMPRALVEMGHELPGVELVAHPVVTDRQKFGAWWTDVGTVRLLAFEYVKYLEAVARTRILPGQSPAGSAQAPTQLSTARRT